MERVVILNNVLQELISSASAELFGLKSGETVIVSSLVEKNGLEKVGVCSEQNDEQHDGLLFDLIGGQLRCQKKKGERFSDVPVEVVDYFTDFHARNQGIVDASVLQQQKVVVIGLGSGGSGIALDLLRAGVVRQCWIDFDVVSVSNLCRSAYDLTDVGRRKTDALLDKALRVNPNAEISCFAENVLEVDYNHLAEIVDSADLVIDCTDTVKSKILLNGMAYNKKPVLFPAVYDLGQGGDILVTVPGVTPCFECVMQAIIPQMQNVSRGDWDYSAGQAKPMPALLSDIKIVVSRTVKIALAILLSDKENSLLEKVMVPGCSLLLIGNEADFWIFEEPFSEVWVKTEVNPECSCQTLR